MSKGEGTVAIGIDLGTTHCCVAYINNNGAVDIIPNKDGDRTTPSYVVLTNKGFIIGKVAKEEYLKPPENVVYVKNSNDKPIIELTNDGEPVCFKPEEISAMLLKHLKEAAEDFIGKPVTDAIITVPAHFNYHQRSATTKAGKLAGLNVLGTINEPTAAALAYIDKNKVDRPKNILIYDLGGGTLDVSIVKIKTNSITVVASAGNTHLGGRDFDNNLVDLIEEKVKARFGEQALNSPVTKRRIKAAAERIKIKLSTLDSTILDLDRLHDEEDVQLEILKEDFEKINFDLFRQTINIVRHCLDDAQLKHSEIDDVVLVGGSTRIPKIQEILGEFFDKKKLSKAVSPDEAVAYGAAVQTQKYLSGNKSEVATVTDVTSLSLGVDAYGDVFSIMIPRNSPIPYSCTTSFYSLIDKQTVWKWKIYQGERALIKDNIYLGECSLIAPPAPPGYTLDLTFNMDEDGIIIATARDKRGLHKTLPIIFKEQTAKDLNDILRDAKIHKSEDKTAKSIIKTWKSLDKHCVKLQALCDYDNKNMNDNDKTRIRDFLKEIDNWIDDNYTENNVKIIQDIEQKIKEIDKHVYPIVKSYGYDVRELSLSDFCELIMSEIENQ